MTDLKLEVGEYSSEAKNAYYMELSIPNVHSEDVLKQIDEDEILDFISNSFTRSKIEQWVRGEGFFDELEDRIVELESNEQNKN